MNMCSIASGSSGNCIYVGNDDTHILIDAGISKKRVVEGLTSIDVDPNKIDAILVTHEHSDHVKGLGVMSRAYEMPIYSTVETINAVLRIKSIGRIKEGTFNFVEPDREFQIGSITVKPFSTSHDASNPVCYTLTDGEKKVAVATDLGKYDDYIIDNLQGLNGLLIEANHDINMLQVGPYPYYLKQRILGDKGHLSNENSAKLLNNIIDDNMKYIFLGHLSKENNYPELAYETVNCSLRKKIEERKIKMYVAKRDVPSEFVTV